MNSWLLLLIVMFVLIIPLDAHALRQMAGIPDMEIPLGQSQEFSWGLVSDNPDESITIQVSAQGLGSEFLIFPESIILEPKTTKYLTIKVTIPEDAKVGYYNPSLLATELGEKGGSVVINVAMEKPVKITVIDTSKTIQPSIQQTAPVVTTTPSVEKDVEEKPIEKDVEEKPIEKTVEVSSTTCGTGTIDNGEGTCIPITNNPKQTSSKGSGGCLIATATYGTELAPQVQLLRELRDNSLLQTEIGTTFMESFNLFYYSFSPIISDLERQNPLFKEAVKLTITPMITTLLILNYVDMDSESSVLGYGISLIILNGMMYVGIPTVAIISIRKNIK